MKQVTLYTDGACLGNPGPGGYGAVLLYQEHRKEMSGGFRLTTNNRMEITAAIIGLSALKTKCSVKLVTDSQLMINTMTKGWVQNWRKNGWKKRDKKDVANPDLWAQLLDLCEYHEVEFVWTQGHSGDHENERCDQLAGEAARQDELPPDLPYENNR